jgi:hypothetical protein
MFTSSAGSRGASTSYGPGARKTSDTLPVTTMKSSIWVAMEGEKVG